jgi:exoribonuclease II
VFALLKELNQSTAELRSGLNQFNADIKAILAKLDYLTLEAARSEGRLAYRLAEGSRVHIMVCNSTYHVQNVGCGIYVRMGAEYFVATNAHNLFDCYRNQYAVAMVLSSD